MTLERVLLPVREGDSDRIDRLIEAVLDIAVPADATVVVAHVIPNRSEWISSTVVSTPGSNYPQALSASEYDDLLEHHSLEEEDVDDIVVDQATVQAIVERLDEAGVDYEVRGAVGEPGDALVALAEELAADRVIVGGRRPLTDKILFGSAAQTLLLESPCPVTFVRDR